MLAGMNIITRPFLPSDTSRFTREHEARRHPARVSLERACFAAARHMLSPYHDASVQQVAKALYNDDVTPIVLRAASSPATTTWLAELTDVASIIRTSGAQT